MEDALKHSTSHQHRSSGRRGSSSSALNPYLIEDIAMTLGELERSRKAAITVTTLR
jgi:hypothetical protein